MSEEYGALNIYQVFKSNTTCIRTETTLTTWGRQYIPIAIPSRVS